MGAKVEMKVINIEEFIDLAKITKHKEDLNQFINFVPGIRQEDSAVECLKFLSKVPSWMFSFLTPTIKIYTKGVGKDAERNVLSGICYAPIKFPDGNITDIFQERGEVLAIRSFKYSTVEYMGLTNLNPFELKIDVPNPMMFKDGYTNEAGFKNTLLTRLLTRDFSYNSDRLYIEFGWPVTGNEDVDKVVERLGGKMSICIYPSGYKLSVGQDKITTVDITGYANYSMFEFKQDFFGIAGTTYFQKLKKHNDKEKEKASLTEQTNKEITDSKAEATTAQIKVLQTNLPAAFSINKDVKSELQKEYNKFFKYLKINKDQTNAKEYYVDEKKKDTNWFIPFRDLIMAMCMNKMCYEAYRQQIEGARVCFVIGEYRKDIKSAGGKLSNVLINIDDLSKKCSEQIKNNQEPITVNAILEFIIKQYLSNLKYVFNGNESEKAKAISIKYNNSAQNDFSDVKFLNVFLDDTLYIVITDINFTVLECDNTKSERDISTVKLNYAKDAGIPILDLNEMNTLITYPITMDTNADEALAAHLITDRWEREVKKVNSQTNATANFASAAAEKDVVLPIRYLTMQAPFSMFGNFILKPYAQIYLDWGSGIFDRFYYINNVSWEINESGKFTTSYVTTQANYL